MNTKRSFSSRIILLLPVILTSIAKAQTTTKFKLSSPAFEEGKLIPAKYTCDGPDISPPLSWTGAPENTKSFALIMDDPDTRNMWVHWLAYNIPGTSNSLAEKVELSEIKAAEGLNSWDDKGYGGPCPPGGSHHYHFKLYALDTTISPKEGMTREELLEAMKGHILGETRLSGIFRNP